MYIFLCIKIKTKEVISLTNKISLESLKLLAIELEVARRAQILASRKQTDLKFDLAELEPAIQSLKDDYNLLKSSQRSARIAKNRNKKRDARNYKGATSKCSQEIDQITQKVSCSKNEIEKCRKKLSNLKDKIYLAEDNYKQKLKVYQSLKIEFDRLTINHTEWKEWNHRQIKKVEELAFYAKVPTKDLPTVVIKSGKNKDEKMRLYYGEAERVYNDNDICNIIHDNGTVYHKDRHNILHLIEDIDTQQA